MTKKTIKAQGERTVMGFDFGTKSIGIAIGQELTGSATSRLVAGVGFEPTTFRL